MTKTALIVDDSPLARQVLSRLLAQYELVADTAPSAEAALEYLKHRRPDVIFMDHLMPGMDGFEALEAIKANPATATIPVMMYTSQEGELYVSQARALGAFGVLPKELKPIEVARVLRALHLIPPADAEPGQSPEPVQTHGADPADSVRVKELLEELFYQQRAALREEIREGYQRALATTGSQPVLDEEPETPPSRFSISRIAAAVLLLLTLTFAYLYVSTSQMLQQANRVLSQLAASTAELTTATAPRPAPDQAPPAGSDLLEVVEWAVNLAGGYGFADVPLDDGRAELIGRLVEYLNAAGFSGTIQIDVHVGRFCMNFAGNGNLELAPAEQPVADCAQVGWPSAEAVTLGRRQSLAFANAVATATDGTSIRVRTTSLGSDQPAVEYPVVSSYLTAGEWNLVAATDNRVDVRLLPDDDYLSRIEARRLDALR